MSRRASGGALAACLITAAIVGFAGGAYIGAQAGDDPATASETNPPDGTTPVGETPSAPGTEAPAGDGLSLSAAQTSVAANERIDLTGAVEPATEGVQLRLERSVDGGDWEVFPLDEQPTTGADGTFSTWVQTGQGGENAFRIVLADDESVVSNEVQVAVG